MSERLFETQEEANIYVTMLKRLAGLEVRVVRNGEHWMVKPPRRTMSIVEITEELLRQVGK